MPQIMKDSDVLRMLSVFKEPVTMDKIVRHMTKTYSEPEEKVRKLVEETLNGGVRNGLVEKHNQFYFRVSDAIDAIGERSEDDEEDDEVESAESYDDIDSKEEILPQPKSNKYNEAGSGGGREPTRHQSKSKQVNKRDIYSAEEKDDEDDEYYKKSHKCNSDCRGFHRKRAADGYQGLQFRSRSASRQR